MAMQSSNGRTAAVTASAAPAVQYGMVSPQATAEANGLVFDVETQSYVMATKLQGQGRGAPSACRLLSQFQAEQGAPVEVAVSRLQMCPRAYQRSNIFGFKCCGIGGLSDRELFVSVYVPKLLNDVDLTRAMAWERVPHVWPVDCIPPFGNRSTPMGICTVHYFRVQTILGEPFFLYAVKKVTPFGEGVGENREYHGGFYEVPAAWCFNLSYAVLYVYGTDGSVEFGRDDGTSFNMTLTDFNGSSNKFIMGAKANFLRDYPTVTSRSFAFRPVKPPAEIFGLSNGQREMLGVMPPAPPAEDEAATEAEDTEVAPVEAYIASDINGNLSVALYGRTLLAEL
jgi:hypothetical protein